MLWTAGFAGIVSFLLVDVQALLALIPFPPEVKLPRITPVFMLLSLVQPTVILTAAVLAGAWQAGKVGLGSPAVEAFVGGGNWRKVLAGQVPSGHAILPTTRRSCARVFAARCAEVTER